MTVQGDTELAVRDVVLPLAAAVQKMAERSRSLQDEAESGEIAYYAKGAADSLELVAERLRTAVESKIEKPGKTSENALLAAFNACLQMLENVGMNGNGAEQHEAEPAAIEGETA